MSSKREGRWGEADIGQLGLYSMGNSCPLVTSHDAVTCTSCLMSIKSRVLEPSERQGSLFSSRRHTEMKQFPIHKTSQSSVSFKRTLTLFSELLLTQNFNFPLTEWLTLRRHRSHGKPRLCEQPTCTLYAFVDSNETSWLNSSFTSYRGTSPWQLELT